MKIERNISKMGIESENFSSLLENLKHKDQGIKVPDKYFDTLSPRIVDAINLEKKITISEVIVPALLKPRVWIPIMAVALVAIVLIFFLPHSKGTIPITDEWAELKMVYDVSYAEEAYLNESLSIDKGLDSTVILNIESLAYSNGKQSTDEEIAEYLKTQDLDNELLTLTEK